MMAYWEHAQSWGLAARTVRLGARRTADGGLARDPSWAARVPVAGPRELWVHKIHSVEAIARMMHPCHRESAASVAATDFCPPMGEDWKCGRLRHASSTRAWKSPGSVPVPTVEPKLKRACSDKGALGARSSGTHR